MSRPNYLIMRTTSTSIYQAKLCGCGCQGEGQYSSGVNHSDASNPSITYARLPDTGALVIIASRSMYVYREELWKDYIPPPDETDQWVEPTHRYEEEEEDVEINAELWEA